MRLSLPKIQGVSILTVTVRNNSAHQSHLADQARLWNHQHRWGKFHEQVDGKRIEVDCQAARKTGADARIILPFPLPDTDASADPKISDPITALKTFRRPRKWIR